MRGRSPAQKLSPSALSPHPSRSRSRSRGRAALPAGRPRSRPEASSVTWSGSRGTRPKGARCSSGASPSRWTLPVCPRVETHDRADILWRMSAPDTATPPAGRKGLRTTSPSPNRQGKFVGAMCPVCDQRIETGLSRCSTCGFPTVLADLGLGPFRVDGEAEAPPDDAPTHPARPTPAAPAPYARGGAVRPHRQGDGRPHGAAPATGRGCA